jgi:hypothetical protein
MLFVDDRLKDLQAAADAGLQTAYFDPNLAGSCNGHRRITRLMGLL